MPEETRARNMAPAEEDDNYAQLPPNNTLYIDFFRDYSIKPIPVKDLNSLADVFAHFRPACECTLSGTNGESINENWTFTSLEDFSVGNRIERSPYLKNLSAAIEEWPRIAGRMAKNGDHLQKILADPETKRVFLALLQTLIQDLTNTKA